MAAENPYIIPVDESLERAMRDSGLFDDMRRGHQARAVVADLNHGQQIKQLGEQTWSEMDGLDFRLEAVMHGTGYHTLALNEGTYDCWNDDGFVKDRIRLRPEMAPRVRSRRTMVTVPGFKRPTPGIIIGEM